MKNLLLLAVVFTAACSNSADRWEIEYAQAKCETRGGIHHVSVYAFGRLNAWCMDGKKIVVPFTPSTGSSNERD